MSPLDCASWPPIWSPAPVASAGSWSSPVPSMPAIGSRPALDFSSCCATMQTRTNYTPPPPRSCSGSETRSSRFLDRLCRYGTFLAFRSSPCASTSDHSCAPVTVSGGGAAVSGRRITWLFGGFGAPVWTIGPSPWDGRRSDAGAGLARLHDGSAGRPASYGPRRARGPGRPGGAPRPPSAAPERPLR